MTEPRRILIIKPSALGDIVHALPVLELIRARFPSAYIAWLVNPPFAGLLDGHPLLNEVIPFDRRVYGTSWRNPLAMAGLLGFLGRLRKKQFDLVIDLQGLFRSGFFARITGARDRVGFANAREGATAFYTRKILLDSVEQHATDRYLKLIQTLGCDVEPIRYTLPRAPLTGEAIAMVREPYAVLLPATNWATKRWPVEYFAQLVNPLRERFGLRTIIAGAKDTIELDQEIGRLTGGETFSLVAKTTLPQLVTLLEGASIVIGNDSGPSHLASALNQPLVMVYGPTSSVRTGPYLRDETVVRLDIICSPCYSRKCSHTSCMKWLTPDMVMREVERALDKSA